MYLALNYMEFDKHFIMLSKKTRNNIMDNSYFYRIYYSDENHNSNGLYLSFSLKNVILTKYFNKLKCSFNKSDNIGIIHSFTLIEKQILELVENFNPKSKTAFRIGEQLDNCFIKIFADIPQVTLGNIKNCDLLLKISGIWSNEKKHGLTFRFYIVNTILDLVKN